MEFAILGPLEVSHRGQRLDVGRPKQQALLAVLLLHPNEVVSTDRLVDDLWEASPPRSVTASLQAHVSRLRAALCTGAAKGGSVVSYHRPGYRIDVAEDDLDVLRFRCLAGRGRAALSGGRTEEARDLLAAGLALWRGRPLAELVLGPFARADLAGLGDLRLAAVEDLLEAKLALGQHRDVLEQLDALVVEHPLRERFWGQRMIALYRCGRQSEALRAYGDLRRALAEQLGIDPSPELQRLEQAVLEQRPEVGWDQAPPPGPRVGQGGARGPGNLPVQLTRFVGRAEERAALVAAVGSRRLVTLVGSGGCGKTRLAVEVAAEVRPVFAGGSWFVDLSPTVDGDGVARAVASALGVHEEPGRPVADTLVAALGDRVLLVVLDNCEQVLRTASSLALDLLERCPGLTVLATSREGLGVGGEACHSVPPLPLPPLTGPVDATSGSEAVQLFVDRATLVRPDFVLSADNAAAVASICHRLDGIPLAIELAAARLAVLSPHQIDERLADRFRLLADDGATRPARHRTLGAVMAWSDALLSDAERALLWRLSVFSGGFTLDAVETVCADEVVERDLVLQHLARLVAMSLVVADTAGHEARYRMLETIRQHGADRLSASGATAGLRAAHARFFTALAERAEPELTGAHQQAWLERLEAEHDNLRAALGWALDGGESEQALGLAGALVLFWRVLGHVGEGREWLDAALAHEPGSGTPPAVLARALWGSGFMSAMLLDNDAAIPALERSLALSREHGDVRGMSRCLLILADCRRFTDGSLATLPLLAEAVSLAREADDPWCLAHALALAGSALHEEGDLARAQEMLGESLDVARAAADAQGTRMALWGLGQLWATEGRLHEAEDALGEGLAVARRLHEPDAAASLAACLAEVLCAQGEHERATALVDEALALAREAGPLAAVAALCARGHLAQSEGDLHEARAAFEEALSVARGAGISSIRANLGLGDVARRLGQAPAAGPHLDEALALSQALGSRQGLAQSLEVLGRLASDDGRSGESWSLHRESLLLYRQAGDVLGMARALAALGGLAARSSRATEGATLLAVARAAFAASGCVPAAGERDDMDDDLALVQGTRTCEILATEAGGELSVWAATELASGLAGPGPPTGP